MDVESTTFRFDRSEDINVALIRLADLLVDTVHKMTEGLEYPSSYAGPRTRFLNRDIVQAFKNFVHDMILQNPLSRKHDSMTNVYVDRWEHAVANSLSPEPWEIYLAGLQFLNPKRYLADFEKNFQDVLEKSIKNIQQDQDFDFW